MKHRILFVTKSSQVRNQVMEFFTSFITDQQVTFRFCHTYKEAESILLSQAPYDLILADAQLHDGTAFCLFAEAKRLYASARFSPHVFKTILLAENTDVKVLENAFYYEVFDFLKLPFQLHHLVNKIFNALDAIRSIRNGITAIIQSDRIEYTAKVIEERNKEVAHNIRAPLYNLSAIINTLSERLSGDGNLLEYLISSEICLEDIYETIATFLSSDKVTDGLPVIKKPFNIRTFVDRTKKTMAEAIANKSLDFKITIDEQLPQDFFANSTELKGIFWNFITNSMKFTLKGSITLDISDVSASDNDFASSTTHRLIKFVFSDTGIGFDPSGIDFESEKTTSQNDTSGTIKGNGMGLLGSYKKIKKLGGKNWDIVSEKNNGTTISFAIPFEIAPPESEILKPSAEDIALLEETNVLLVDDEEIHHMTHREAFISAVPNHRGILKSVFDLKDAENEIQKNVYHVVLTDIRLKSDENGFQLATKTRNKMNIKQPVIIGISANNCEQECLESGMNGFLEKELMKLKKYLIPMIILLLKKTKLNGHTEVMQIATNSKQ